MRRKDSIEAPIIVTMAVVHIWSIVLCFQNNEGVWKWITALATLCLPFLAELFWGWWAIVHRHPYAIGAFLFFLLPAIYGLIFKFSKKK